MPDMLFPSKDALPEELRPFAKDAADGNGVVVNLVPNERLKEFRENNIKIVQERDDLKTFQDKVTKVFPEFDPDTVTTELTELRGIAKRVKDGDLTENKAIEEAIAERTKEMKKTYEDQLRSAAEARRNSEAAKSQLEMRLKRQTVRQAVLGVTLDEKVGVASSAVEDIVSRAYNVFQVGDDGETMVPKKGDTVLYGSDGTTAMSVTEWVQSLKDTSPHLFRSSNGGGNSATENKAFAGFTKAEFDKLSPEDKIAAANQVRKPKGY